AHLERKTLPHKAQRPQRITEKKQRGGAISTGPDAAGRIVVSPLCRFATPPLCHFSCPLCALCASVVNSNVRAPTPSLVPQRLDRVQPRRLDRREHPEDHPRARR